MNNIREIRKKRGITQKQLANALDVTESAVSHWEKGRRDPDLETLLKTGNVCTVRLQNALTHRTKGFLAQNNKSRQGYPQRHRLYS